MVIPGILVRHVGRAVLLGIALVAVLLLGLYTIIELIRESRALTGDYGPLQMVIYIAQTSPRRLYDIFPFAALIGTMLGLGGLAAANELVAMRAAGFDRRQILVSVMGAVLLCVIALMTVSEFLVPGLEARAGAERDQARTGQVHLGRYGALWIRDGAHMLRIGHSAWSRDDQPEFGDLLIYRVDQQMRPEHILRAETATHDGQAWLMRQVSYRNLESPDEVRIGVEHERRMDSTLSHDLFSSVISRPRVLSVGDLAEMIEFLEVNGLDTATYEQALWNRVFFPLNVLAMILVSLPFAFRGGRHSSRGINLFFGVSLGLAFFVISRLSQGMGMLMPGPLWLSALMPSLAIGMLGILMLRRL
ncbi:LPS export ABC transporter permease LptG [Wenzhouxiangella sp. AB-CW3]|uniref:LPS export ABC transporter permease LptG n=1 Tax=Wenzhouxiangella sp. AB-CW3 TaxID=2771012 RepID=UPI00168AE312|nr:LPS export ABC transporter permease LptG [Wenzhouxiangella sp. AB-CW3]QOC23036.1 LPS export ABC transporter permease LptG [Wenzhouxiangella sp. AB-CW3]